MTFQAEARQRGGASGARCVAVEADNFFRAPQRFMNANERAFAPGHFQWITFKKNGFKNLYAHEQKLFVI